MVYQFRAGKFARGGVTAQTIGEVCAKLESQQSLTAEKLVEVSRPKDAPLHPAFEWSDRKAAAEWRLHQARNLINAVEVVVEDKPPVRAFFNLEVRAPEYKAIETICKRADDRALLLANALRDLRAWSAKYYTLRDWVDAPTDPIFREIDRLNDNARPTAP